MVKNEDNLVDKFKEIETEILSILKNNKLDFDENLDNKTLKSRLKKYIANVKKAEKLFEEYELIADKIEKASADAQGSHKINKEVVELRKEAEESVIVEKTGDVIVVKRKKKIKGVEKEF